MARWNGSLKGVTPLFSTRALSGLLLVLMPAILPTSVGAQDDDLAGACAAVSNPECQVAAAAVRTIHPRVGLALWGGNPVPGTASTLGMRLGSVPRFSGSSRVVVLPVELPPLPDRSADEASRATAVGLSTQLSVGILQGISPLPTVGGFLALDAVGRASWFLLPDGQGFADDNVLGASLGLRLGLLRESFTMPGLSLTGSYGQSTRFAFGDPAGGGDGFIEGGIGNLNLTAATTKRVGLVSLTAAGSLDRYMTAVDFRYPGGPSAAQTATGITDRWSVLGNVSWTFMILHASLEAGWQQAPVPDGLPAAVVVNPTGWWAGAALRLSI